MKKLFIIFIPLLLISCQSKTQQPIRIAEQGSFAIGGSIINNKGTFDSYKLNSEGQTLHGDHAYVFYQKPINAHTYPLVFLHGAGQSKKTWETTADGREGFQNIFLRREYSVFLVDQPRRGDAGKSTIASSIAASPDEQYWFNVFRLGMWPHFFKGVQFSDDKEALNQYFRAMTPNTGPFDEAIISDAISELFTKIGKGILVTHSQGGGPGWLSVIKNQNIRAVIAYEPGSGFVFPKEKLPQPMPTQTGTLAPVEISLQDFKKLTQIPIVIYYGDNIPEEYSPNPAQDQWRVRLEMAKIWVDTINEYGGKATLVHLPKIGIYGNTHFPFSDLNNRDIADLMEKFIIQHHLDS